MTSQAGYDFSLANKVAVVTDGASGIGAAIVDAYGVKGATVVVLDKDVDSAQRKVSQGTAAAAFTCDVTREESIIAAISAVSTKFGRVDVLSRAAKRVERHQHHSAARVNSAGLAVINGAPCWSTAATPFVDKREDLLQ
jgi:NAD(P)-dependent dehydrogenase (short-subunit alcohol dehydrogenase family)